MIKPDPTKNECGQTTANDELVCAVAELTYNGQPIHWTYWQDRKATPHQAAKLANCIDPITWAGNQYKQGTIPKPMQEKIQRIEEWLAERSDQWTLSSLVDAIGTDAAPYSMKQAVIYGKQEQEKRDAGRYTLGEAAGILEEQGGMRADSALAKLREAVESGALSVYEPGRDEKYKPKPVRDFYEEAYWNDLNKWLADNEPRISFMFPAPSGVAEKGGQVVPVGTTSRLAAHSDEDSSESKRRNRLYQEIELIKGFELMSAARICADLNDVAGSTKSCVIEVKQNSIRWIDGNGGVQETQRTSLGKWLQRHPKRKITRT